MKTLMTICSIILVVTGIAQAITLTPTSYTRLYSYTDSQQTNGTTDTQDDELLGTGGTEAVADAIRPPTDGLALEGYSSFAIASSTIDGAGYHQLNVVNQGSGDPGGVVEGWGYSVAYMLITYATAPGAGESIGDPMVVTLDVLLGPDPYTYPWPYAYLYTGGEWDDAFLDVGYALGTGLTDYNPVEADPYSNPNPGLGQFDEYISWNLSPPRGDPAELYPSLSDSLAYIGVIGDEVQVLLAMSSYSYSNWGYSWTNAGLEGTLTAIPEPATMLLLGLGGVVGLVSRKRSA